MIKKKEEWCKLIPEEDKGKRKLQVYSLLKKSTETRESRKRSLKLQEEEFQKFLTENSTIASIYRRERVREED